MTFGATPKDSSQLPVSSTYVPGQGFIALQGVAPSADGLGNISAPVATSPLPATTGTPTSVAGSVSSVVLLASNTGRKGAYIYNASSATLSLGLFVHTSLSTSVYTTQVPAGNLYELPTSPLYTGEISGVWASASGSAKITEMS